VSDVFWTGVPDFAARLAEITAKANLAAREAVVEAASELENFAKQRASGRPGPDVRTGTLRRGITHDPVRPAGLGWETNVGPTVIYSRRIELGFYGADSLGRHYAQPPFPYFTPAFEAVNFEAIYAAHWAGALL
jgi:bacteriophage HK97-gp10 putative tail-component